MYQNDKYGCCTCVSIAHMMQVWSANGLGKEIQLTDKNVLDLYRQVNGGVDQGANMVDVLNLLRRQGMAGHRIGFYCGVTPNDIREVKQSIWLTGSCYLGVALPLSAQEAKKWFIPTGRIPLRDRWLWQPGGWGGHAIAAVDYDTDGVYSITWGQEMFIQWRWLQAYCEEAYALGAPEWVTNTRKAPNGLSVKDIMRDVQIATGEKVV
jgi:hypothetical protein